MKFIVAIDSNGGMAKSNSENLQTNLLPWHCPSDLKFFKQITIGSIIVMGSTTFKSLNRPSGLPSRLNIVISSKPKPEFIDDLVEWMTMEKFLFEYKKLEELTNKKIFVIGGKMIYDQLISLCDEGGYISMISNSCLNEIPDMFVPNILDIYNKTSNSNIILNEPSVIIKKIDPINSLN